MFAAHERKVKLQKFLQCGLLKLQTKRWKRTLVANCKLEGDIYAYEYTSEHNPKVIASIFWVF